MKVAKQFFGLFMIAASMMSCQSGAKMPTDFSEKTGFDYNNPRNGFFTVNSVYEGKLPPGTVYISVMTTVKGVNNDPVSAPNNNAKRRISNSGYRLYWRVYNRRYRNVARCFR